jgi:hypothetical protein
MSIAKQLALIALGYAVATAGGFAAVAANELMMPADIAQGSSGMVAFGDMVLFVLVTGFLCLAPTWFLLRLLATKWPRALRGVLIAVAVMGPLSWLTMVDMAGASMAGATAARPHYPEWFGLWIAFAAIPRIVAGPVLVMGEGVALLVSRSRPTRSLLGAAIMMDLVPIGLFARHMLSASA